MRLSFKKSVLAISLATLSSAGIAGGEPDQSNEPQGVVVDISDVDLESDLNPAIFEPSLDAGSADSFPEIAVVKAASIEEVVEVQESSGAASQTGSFLSALETAPESEVDSTPKTNRGAEILSAITTAMRPQETVPPLTNDRLSFYLNESVAYAQYERSAKRFGLDNGRTHVGFLYSESRDSILQGGLALDATFARSIRLSVGARGYVALLNRENEDAVAAALGAETAYRLPFQALPLEFGASLYYAPDILTFGTADGTLDAQVDVTFPVRDQLSVFGGYRFLQVDVRQNDREVDNRLHLGVRWDLN